MSNDKTLTFYPFAYVLLDEELDNYCWYCLAENSGNHGNQLRKCSGCKIALFCNKNCQNLGWLDHKPECKALAKRQEKQKEHTDEISPPNSSIPDVEIRMLGRIVWRYKSSRKRSEKVENNKSENVDDSFYLNRSSRRNIMQIWDHSEDMRKDVKALVKFRSTYQRLVDFYDKKFLLDEETCFQLHCRNYINRHAISDGAYLKEIGKGLYLDMCQYDHSCRPNTVYTCNGFVATLRPLNNETNIEEISKTFYTYIDLLMCKQQRRKALKDSWYFWCQCTRCLDQSEHVLTSVVCDQCSSAVCIFEKDDLLKEENSQCDKCAKIVDKERVIKAIAAMRFLDRFVNCEIDSLKPYEAKKILVDILVDNKLLLHRTNVYYVRVLQAAIARTNPEDTDSLLSYHLEATDCMRVCYPVNHPALSYHLLNIGIFYCKLEKYKEAKSFLDESLVMLKYALGDDHSLSKQAVEWLQVCDKAC